MPEQIAAAAEEYFASVRDDGYIVDCVTGESLADAVVSRLGLTEEVKRFVGGCTGRRWVSAWAVVGGEK